MNDETKKHLQKLESDLSALRIILDSPPHDGRHAEAQSAFRVARLTFGKLVDVLGDVPELQRDAQTKQEIETPIVAAVRDALDRVLERIVREALGQ